MPGRSRRQFLEGSLALAGAGLLAGCGLVPSRAGGSARVWRLGFLSPIVRLPVYDGLSQGLTELGYVEGENLATEYRYAEGQFERLPALAAELVRLNIDVMVVTSNVATRAAKAATGTIPIVMALSNDPVADGIVASLARPGGNVTGLTQISEVLTSKRLELLKEAVPSASRVGVLAHAGSPTQDAQWEAAGHVARAGRFQVQRLDVSEPSDLAPAFKAAGRDGVDALVLLDNAMFTANRSVILDLCRQHRLPTMHVGGGEAREGGLMSYGPNFYDTFRRAAGFVDKVLKGAKPADLPVEQPSKFEHVVNLKTAQAIGLTIPDSVLTQATEIVR